MRALPALSFRSAVAAALALAVTVTPATVAAHAALLESSPPDGAALDAAPREIVLRFNEPVEPVFVRLLDARGTPRAVLDAAPYAAELRLAAPAGLDAGSYVVSYRVVSADSHPISGSLVFGIGAEPPAAAHAPSSIWGAAVVVHRFLYDATLPTVAGITLFLILVGGGRAAPVIRRGFWLFVGLGAVAAAAGVAVKGGEIGALRLALISSAGFAAATALVGLALLFAGRLMRHRGPALAGVAAIAASYVVSGHTAVADPRWLASLCLFIHILAASFWIGSLWPLLAVLRYAPEDAPRTVVRFSALAMWLVPVLLAAGIAMAAINLGSLTALIEEPYGRLLVLKSAGVAALLGLAAWNKWRLTQRKDWRRLAHSIRAEIVIAGCVLAITAALSQTPPPASIHRHHATAGTTTAVVAGRRLALIRLDPASVGVNRLTVRFADFQAMEAVAELALPQVGIEPIRRTLSGDREFTAEVALPVAGRWRVAVDALVSDFERVRFATEIAVR